MEKDLVVRMRRVGNFITAGDGQAEKLRWWVDCASLAGFRLVKKKTRRLDRTS
jgi:hypothetical protein